MKRKIVVQMPLDTEEHRREAMKLSVKVNGVTSVSLDKDKGQVTVIGEDVDPVSVANALKDRKFFLGCLWSYNGVEPVNLVTVEEVKPEEKKAEEKKDEKKPETLVVNPYWHGMPLVYHVIEEQGRWW